MEKMAGSGSSGSVSRGSLRSHGSSKSQSFLILGLLVVVLILGFNYWNASTRNTHLTDELIITRKQIRVCKDEATAKIEAIHSDKKTIESALAKKESELMEERRIADDIKSQMEKLKEENIQLKTDYQTCKQSVQSEKDSCKDAQAAEKEHCDERIEATKEEYKDQMGSVDKKCDERLYNSSLSMQKQCKEYAEQDCRKKLQQQFISFRERFKANQNQQSQQQQQQLQQQQFQQQQQQFQQNMNISSEKRKVEVAGDNAPQYGQVSTSTVVPSTRSVDDALKIAALKVESERNASSDRNLQLARLLQQQAMAPNANNQNLGRPMFERPPAGQMIGMMGQGQRDGEGLRGSDGSTGKFTAADESKKINGSTDGDNAANRDAEKQENEKTRSGTDIANNEVKKEGEDEKNKTDVNKNVGVSASPPEDPRRLEQAQKNDKENAPDEEEEEEDQDKKLYENKGTTARGDSNINRRGAETGPEERSREGEQNLAPPYADNKEKQGQQRENPAMAAGGGGENKEGILGRVGGANAPDGQADKGLQKENENDRKNPEEFDGQEDDAREDNRPPS